MSDAQINSEAPVQVGDFGSPPLNPPTPRNRNAARVGGLDLKKLRTRIDPSEQPPLSAPVPRAKKSDEAPPTFTSRFNFGFLPFTFESRQQDEEQLTKRGAKSPEPTESPQKEAPKDTAKDIDLTKPAEHITDSISSLFHDSTSAIGTFFSSTFRSWSSPALPAPIVQSKPTFGVPLNELPLQHDVPTFIACVLEYFYANETWLVEGVFRLSGNHAKMDTLENEWNKGIYKIDPLTDAHDVTGLMKRFFKALKEPIITAALHNSFMVAVGPESVSDPNQVSNLKALIDQLPQLNRTIIHRIVYFLRIVSFHSNVNRMTDINIGKTLGPTMFTFQNSINHLGTSVTLMVCLIQHFTEIFGKEYSRLPFEVDYDSLEPVRTRNRQNTLVWRQFLEENGVHVAQTTASAETATGPEASIAPILEGDQSDQSDSPRSDPNN